MECGHLVLRWWTSPCDHDWASWDWIMGGLQWLQMHLLWESVNILLRRIMEPASPIMILWGMCHPVHGSPSSGTCIFIYNQEMHLLWVFPTARWLKLWQLRPFLALDYVFMCFMKSLGSFPHRLTKSRQSKLRKDSGTSKDFLKNGVNNHTFLYNHGFPFRIGLVECKPE